MHAGSTQAVFYLFILLKAQKKYFYFYFLLKKLSQPCKIYFYLLLLTLIPTRLTDSNPNPSLVLNFQPLHMSFTKVQQEKKGLFTKILRGFDEKLILPLTNPSDGFG